MKRRGFLKLLGIGAPAVAVATQLPEAKAKDLGHTARTIQWNG